MARVRSFRGVRYDPSRVDLGRVLAPPYDVVSPAERQRLALDPRNVVHLELPLDEAGEGSRYEDAARRLERWMKDGTLRRDPAPFLYPYVQSFEHQGKALTRRGFFGLVELVELGAKGGIFPHELTLRGPREDRLRLLRATHANLSPVFLLYEDRSGKVREALERASPRMPPVAARTDRGTREGLVALGEASAARIEEALSGESLVFADGHHRYESALQYHLERKGERAKGQPGGTSEQADGYALAVFVERSDPGLLVLPTHRIVRCGPRPVAEWGRMVEACFEVTRFTLDSGPEAALESALGWLRERQTGRGAAFVVGLGGASDLLGLELRNAEVDALFESQPDVPPPMRSLDVVALQALLEGGFGITRQDVAEREALGYTRDPKEAMAALEQGAAAIVLLNPIPVERVMSLATQGFRLPQKSTYFHPKLTSGWLFHVHDRPEILWGSESARQAMAAPAHPSSRERE